MEEVDKPIFWQEKNKHIEDWDNRSHVKNLGQVAAVIIGVSPPPSKTILWYDVSHGRMRFYNKFTGNWDFLDKIFIDGENIGEGEGQFFNEKIEDENDSTMLYRTIRSENSRINIRTTETEIIIGNILYSPIDSQNISIMDSENKVIVL